MRLALLLLLVGCGGTAATPPSPPRAPRPPSVFPTATQLATIAAEPAPAVTSDAVDVPTWDLQGPFPDALASTPEVVPGPWGAMLDAAVQRGALTPTASLHCVAREIGRFYLQHQAQPTEALRRTVDGWCGNTAVYTELRFYGGAVPAQIGDDAVHTSWKGDVATMIASFGAMPGAVGGIWYGRDHGRAVIAIARAVPWAEVDPASVAPDDAGALVVRGRVLLPTEKVRALVNRGALGFASCDIVDGVALPRFEARCQVDAADPAAWIELSSVHPGRVLGKVVLRVLARRPSATPSHALVDRFTGAATTPERVNQARLAAGLSPLAVVDAQSAVASQLAPHFFAAMLRGDVLGLTDKIGLGLMAGWSVSAQVATSGLFSAWTTGTGHGSVVAAALDSPLGRSVLLDPHATHLAVGELAESADVHGSLFLAYGTLPAEASAAAATVLSRIQAARSARGLPPLRPIDSVGSVPAKVAAALTRGEMEPEDAMSRLLDHVVATTQRDARAGYVGGYPLDEMPLPEGALAPGEHRVLLVVAPSRPEGEAWWHWAVLLVVI